MKLFLGLTPNCCDNHCSSSTKHQKRHIGYTLSYTQGVQRWNKDNI